MYDFAAELEGRNQCELGEEIRAAAFEMDVTWSNMDMMAKRMLEIHSNNTK